MVEIKGIAASRGIAIGPISRLTKPDLSFDRRKISDPEAEIDRLEQALERVQVQLEATYQAAKQDLGQEEAAIFQAQAMILEDPELMSGVKEQIREGQLNAEAALKERSEQYAGKLEKLDDEYFQQRAADVRDVIDQTLAELLGVAQEIHLLEEPSIVLAADLTPSDTVNLDKSKVLGFLTAGGGSTSHTAILARGLRIPAVVGAGSDALGLPEGAEIILDGTRGVVISKADPEMIASYRSRQERAEQAFQKARQDSGRPAQTRDGHQVEVVANIGNLSDVEPAQEFGAEGVGLLRTEFVYLDSPSLPDEEQQTQIYREILDAFEDQPVILRTLDIGGDKELPYLDLPQEANPFLGLRAIRLSLTRIPLFKTQLRAALRAGAGRNLKIMFPMISQLDELQKAKSILDDCRHELESEAIPFADNLEIGIMIEVPSAALLADQFLPEIDFFSIGTNDLSQYTYAADRVNNQVSPLADGLQPAVLRLIARVIDTAHQAGKWVGLCGELAGRPAAIPILLGLGLDEFSMNPPAIPFAKQLIRGLNQDELRDIAHSALDLSSAQAVKAYITEHVPQIKEFL